MNVRNLLDEAYTTFSSATGGDSEAGQQSYYVEVPVELTLSRLTVKDDEDAFHEVHESPFQLFTGTGRTGIRAPSLSFLVGQYGMGKTSFVHQLCAKLRAENHLALAIDLADCRQAYGAASVAAGLNEEQIVEFLLSPLLERHQDKKAFLDFAKSELVHEIQAGRVTLVLDSLDELGINRKRLQEFLQALLGVLMPKTAKDPFKSRALIAVRAEYMAAFGMDSAQSTLGEELSQLVTVYFLKLGAFTHSRIESYLERRNNRELSKHLNELPVLRDILVRPLFLRIFCDHFKGLQKRDLRQLRSPTALIQSFIQQASVDTSRHVRKGFQWKEDGLATIALDLYRSGTLNIPIDQVSRDLIRSHKITKTETWAAIHKCPFLRKISETHVRFSHKVFIEYFTAKALLEEGTQFSKDELNAFDTIVLDVDTRKFLKDLYANDHEWYARTRRSYGFDEKEGWRLLDDSPAMKEELDSIRKSLLDYMTVPERMSVEEVRPIIHRFITIDEQPEQELHPCYRMYNYEAVTVFLWHNRRLETDQRMSEHFEKLLTGRLEELNRKLNAEDALRPHFERLVERILSIGERLRYDPITRFSQEKLVDKIAEPDTKARIKQIVASA